MKKEQVEVLRVVCNRAVVRDDVDMLKDFESLPILSWNLQGELILTQRLDDFNAVLTYLNKYEIKIIKVEKTDKMVKRK